LIFLAQIANGRTAIPKSKQKFVSEMLDAVIAQAQQAGTDS